jgi:aromatic ring-opening dioxygenase catalytic subunit (LigB family)
MQSKSSVELTPVLFIPHGGGPLPLMGDKSHEYLIAFLKEIAKELGQPSAIVLISAHWEEKLPTITGGSHPAIIYDYNNFPPETYEIQYPASGDPSLARRVQELIKTSGVDARVDDERGFDHGLFVPLKLMYPEAEIPCIQLSLFSDLNPENHIALGKSLAALREENILIIGSGLSFHNMGEFFSTDTTNNYKNVEFDNWLVETCSRESMSPADREERLIGWENAPHARYCHPREEHFLPLHVCYGVASRDTPKAEVVFNNEVLGKRVTGLLWR